MKARDTIFDSKPEKTIFKYLQSHWYPKLIIYPQLPFAKIVKIGQNELSARDWQFYLDTNVDYTIADLQNGHPELSIEFDGIGQGFSRETTYHQFREVPENPYRKFKMEKKLNWAKKANYPLIVVSCELEKGGLVKEEEFLCILDSIIGQFLARKERDRLLNEAFSERKAEIEALPESKKREAIYDLMSGAEVAAESRMDPIAKKVTYYWSACLDHGINYATFYGGPRPKNWNIDKDGGAIEFLDDPPLPDFDPSNLQNFEKYLDKLEARCKGVEEAIKTGCRIILKIPGSKVQPMPVTIWVQNFEGAGISPVKIAENVAMYFAFKRAYELLNETNLIRGKTLKFDF